MSTQASYRGLPRGVDIVFESDLFRFILKVPYNPEFLYRSGFQDMDKEWLPEQKAWRMWPEDFYDVLELVYRYFRR